MTAERVAWIFLNHIASLTGDRFHRLLMKTRSAAALLNLSFAELENIGVPEALAQEWSQAFQDSDLWKATEWELDQSEKKLFRIATELDSDYPAPLSELVDRPPVVYVKGLWPPPDTLAISLVGTRRASPYGLAVADRLTCELVREKVTTVSGLALGVDTQVHQSTLKAGGYTVAVLGSGLKYVYPSRNAGLYSQIAERGALVTEFPYNSPPDMLHFPRRNRIISGLSRGIVVVEAGFRSGALITARCGAEQGRDVFAVPGNVFRSTSAGCHRLLREGAKLVETAQDILEEYDHRPSPQATMDSLPRVERNDRLDNLSPLEKKIYEMLSAEPISVEYLVEKTIQPVDQLANALLSLELKGLIQNLPGQRYVANNS